MRFFFILIFFSLISPKLLPQRAPLDRCIRDSLFRLKPPQNLVQQAGIYLELAEMMHGYLPEKAFSYAVLAFRISILEKNDSLKAQARIVMGDYYTTRRRFTMANEQLLAGWKTYQRINDTAGQVSALIKISIINRSLENYPKALEYLNNGINIAKKTHNKSLNGMLCDQFGLTYQAMGDRQAAIYFFDQALSLFRQAGDKNGACGVQINIGSFFLNENKIDEGLAFYSKLIQESNTVNSGLKGILYTRIGHLYFMRKDFRTSLTYNLKAFVTRKYHPESPELNSSLVNIAGDYYCLEKPDSGKLYMDSGLILAQRLGRKNILKNGYHVLYKYYLKLGNHRLALDNFTRYTNFSEEIALEQSRNNIAILETNQQLQRLEQSRILFDRQHDIQALNLKYHNYTTFFLEILMALAGFSIIIFMLLMFHDRRVRRKMQELNVALSDEIMDRKFTEDQTHDRETQYKFITDHSMDFITQLDQHRNRTYASPASVNIFGYSPEEMIRISSDDLTHPDFHAYREENYLKMIESRSSAQFIYKALKKDATVFWVESILNPLFDPITGAFKGLVGVTRDIHERKTKELEIMEGTKQKELLLKEIHHRVKNNFAILVSLINMQMAQTKNQELLQSLTNLQLRIRTMALVHEMLYRSSDFEKISFPGYLRSLASVIAGTYNRRDVELSVDAEEAVMDIEASIPLGLIINEIVSNAFKHAFPDGRAGKIWIRFTADELAGRYSLKISDDGTGLAGSLDISSYPTMGLQIVQILCNQIEAALEVVNDPGASFTITFMASSK
jgi:PAS domain S-box-containing protein